MEKRIEDKTLKPKISKTVRDFEMEDVVLIKQEIRNKDDARWEGPYKVIKKIHERSYLLKDQNGKMVVRNVEKIKHFKKGGCEELKLKC